MERIQKGIIILLIFLFGIETCLSQQIHRSSFPEGFVFGTSSSAFQYEGAVKEDGRGPTIWDTFSHSFGRIKDFSHADVTVDHYHRYPEDIQYLQDMGMDVFRFSISWSRIFPDGTGEVNQAGVDHYNKVIDTLLAKGIEPYVTLFHWDLPQALEDRYKGWLDPQVIKDFTIYAETCFEKFGDRVKHWITINEPHSFAVQGYASGKFAPGRCTKNILRPFCSGGNSSTEPYIVGHNLLLAHANVADVYRNKYKPDQHGSVGIALDVIWFEPSSNSPDDIEATQRAQDFQLGWFLDPLMFGDYPSSMISRVGSRLPSFSESDSALLKGSLDFVGINHYTTFYAKHNVTGIPDLIVNITQLPDSDSVAIPFKNGKAIGDKAHSIWLYIVPEGMRSLMNYIKQKYGNPIVIITENGMDDGNSPFVSRKTALKDEKRIKYFNDYLTNLLAAIKEDGCNVRGYFAWSLLDNWEWDSGFSCRFGLYYVDYKNLKRYPKNSVQWFKDFLTQNYKDIQDL